MTDQHQARNTGPIDRFMSWRYGLFIHWSPISVIGHEIGWSRENERPEILNKPGNHQVSARVLVPAGVYDSLYRHFNPTEFSADALVRRAIEWGVRYIYFTSKHHDGFCNFDSAHTDYKITSPECPYGRDIVKDLSDACHEHGMGFGIYYSQPDWRHPDYRTERHEDYVRYLHAQVEELCTRYGKVDVLWFDGLVGTEGHMTGVKTPDIYNPDGGRDWWNAEALLAKIRSWQPDILINDRCGMPGDFSTPEQRIGDYAPDQPWESCITIGDQWAYRFFDNYKSPAQCLQSLISAACGGGNFALNVGPDRLGLLDPQQIAVLDVIGEWLSRYGETIYATRGGPYPRWEWGGSTHRDNTVYLHVLRWPEHRHELRLPLGGASVKTAEIMTGGRLDWDTSDDWLRLRLPLADQDRIDTIVRLELDRLPGF